MNNYHENDFLVKIEGLLKPTSSSKNPSWVQKTSNKITTRGKAGIIQEIKKMTKTPKNSKGWKINKQKSLRSWTITKQSKRAFLMSLIVSNLS